MPSARTPARAIAQGTGTPASNLTMQTISESAENTISTAPSADLTDLSSGQLDDGDLPPGIAAAVFLLCSASKPATDLDASPTNPAERRHRAGHSCCRTDTSPVESGWWYPGAAGTAPSWRICS